MRTQSGQKMVNNWVIMLMYIVIILATLYVGPRGWDIGIWMFGSHFYKVSDLITILILITLFLHIFLEDVANRKIRDGFRYLWLIVIGWAVVVTMSKVEDPFDRLHITEYLLVGFITFRVAYEHVRTRAVYIATAVAITVFALLEELAQWAIPGRRFELSDLYIDAWSAILALFIIDFAVGPEYVESLAEKAIRRFFRSDRSELWTDIKDFWFDLESRIIDFFNR